MLINLLNSDFAFGLVDGDLRILRGKQDLFLTRLREREVRLLLCIKHRES